jgi:hypothetical protein
MSCRLSTTSLVALLLACASPTHQAKPKPAIPESQAPHASTEESGWSKAVNVGCGFVLTESHHDVHFQLNLFGDDVRQVPKQDHLWWLVDGILVETTVAIAGQIGDPDARGHELLKKYLAWETSYTAKQNGWPPVTPHAAPAFKVGGFDALTWVYPFPTPVTLLDDAVTGVAYGAVAVDHVVFAMAAFLRDRGDVERGIDVIYDVLGTIKRTQSSLDVEALSRELKSIPPEKRWHGCPT